MAVPPTSPSDAKPALRRRFRLARRTFAAGLGVGERARLEAALATVLVARLGPGPVAGYHATGDEIRVPATCFPRVAGSALDFHACAVADLLPGFAGIAEPPASAARVAPAIVLVPLVAVDRHGTRLGQGGGHYDRTLAALRAAGPVLAIGVAWDMQVVDALPADPWDEPLDALATPSGWLTFGSARPMSRR